MSRNKNWYLVEAVISGDGKAWSAFVDRMADVIYSAALMVFPADEAEAESLRLFERLRANDFAALRDYDGRSHLETFLTLRLAELLIERILGLLIDDSDRGWAAFQEFYENDIRRLVARNFPTVTALEDGSSVEDKIQDVYEKLIANDYKRLRGFGGKGSFTGYVRKTVSHICADLRRSMIGRRRLPSAIEKLPALEQQIFRQIQWHRTRADELIHTLRDSDGHAYESSEIQAALATVDKIIAEINTPERPTGRNTIRIDGDDNLALAVTSRLSDSGATPEEAVIEAQSDTAWEKLLSCLSIAMERLPEDARLYLRYRYLEIPPLAPRDIAPLMRIPITEIYRRRQSWETALAAELSSLGIDNLEALSV